MCGVAGEHATDLEWATLHGSGWVAPGAALRPRVRCNTNCASHSFVRERALHWVLMAGSVGDDQHPDSWGCTQASWNVPYDTFRARHTTLLPPYHVRPPHGITCALG